MERFGGGIVGSERSRNDPLGALVQETSFSRFFVDGMQRQIEELSQPDKHEPLLSTIFVYADLRFGSDPVLKILGDRKVLAETPLIKQFIAEGRQDGLQKGRQEGKSAKPHETRHHRSAINQ